MISPRLWATAAATLARTYGARGTLLRGVHEARRRVGHFRLTPRYVVQGGQEVLSSFAVDAKTMAEAADRDEARARAERIVAGGYQAFRSDWRPFPQDPDGWVSNGRTSFHYGASEPWWRVPHQSSSAGDIKDVWEPGRFAWVYDLVRGYLLSADPRYARSAFDRLAEWTESSPPFRGVHWSCGQETAIRAIALLYLEANLARAPGIGDADRVRLRDMLAASGERIADAIGYAVSQRNNHAISEAVGLIVLGARFRGAHPEAPGWLRRGRQLLERLILEQFAPDGWYIQHSFTYLRLALDQCIVAERALRPLGMSLSERATERLRAATRLLLALVDSDSGIVPNHGANDGAFVHPITLTGYRDFRPVITAACAMFGEALPADVPIDREVLAWLRCEAPAPAPARADEVRTGASGWAVARVGDVVAFLRAGRYRSRPSHLDPLHLDVRVDGRELVVDPGTFAYGAPAPWRNALVTARVHNGPLLDGREPGTRGPRFLWLVWPRAALRNAVLDRGSARLVAEIPAMARRTVVVGGGFVEVLDEVLAAGLHDVRIAWLLHPDATPQQIVCAPPARIVEASEDDVTAWFSPLYGVRVPSRAVIVEARTGRCAPLRTRIGSPSATTDRLQLDASPAEAASR